MYYPHEVTLDMGGTLVVPGSHLRRINETDIGRYQNLVGQVPLVCPAGTVLILHHGIWHCGRRNDTDQVRYMFKIRLNPTVRQVRLWNTDDLDDPAVAAELRQTFPWYENATGRLEITNRSRLWRFLTGDESYDTDYWLTRVENAPTRIAPAASA
jgi:ectoine hydroxylase-related dioxygenase (phytanoyl-CoA dioxygenase family)